MISLVTPDTTPEADIMDNAQLHLLKMMYYTIVIASLHFSSCCLPLPVSISYLLYQGVRRSVCVATVPPCSLATIHVCRWVKSRRAWSSSGVQRQCFGYDYNDVPMLVILIQNVNATTKVEVAAAKHQQEPWQIKTIIHSIIIRVIGGNIAGAISRTDRGNHCHTCNAISPTFG